MRKSGVLQWLQPDAKSQVTFRYEDSRPVAIDAVVLSTQHDEGVDLSTIRDELTVKVIDALVPKEWRSTGFRAFINPTGRFVTGGPKGDAGLTGRKSIVDTYGGSAPHGGGAFSGKDPSKVDRSVAYLCRFLAKQVVGRGWAKRAPVQLAYAIGVAEPASFAVETYGTESDSKRDITKLLATDYDLRPQRIIEQLDLLRPIYFQTAAYGHFGGTDIELPWEQVQ